MAQKKTADIAAVIHIGGNAARLRISQVKKGKIFDLEKLEYPLMIGHEVFSNKKISFSTIHELNKALAGFMQLIGEYGVEEYRAVAASALRDAQNRILVVDQLKVQNGIDVEVLENSVEKTLIYYKISRTLDEAGILLPGRTLYTFVGSGTLGLALAEGQNMVYAQNLPMGALKYNEIITDIKRNTEEFSQIAEEYLQAVLKSQNFLNDSEHIHNLVISGSSLELVARLTDTAEENGIYRVPRKKIVALYDKLKDANSYAAAAKLNISENAASLLYAVLTIYTELMRRVDVTEVILPRAALTESIMEQMLISGAKKTYREYIRQNALSCARKMAVVYECNEAHGEFVLNAVVTIFDKLKKLHGLGANERLVLELAAILHECGNVVSARNHLAAAFDMLRRSEIYGVTFKQRLLAAYVVKYDEFSAPNVGDADYAALTDKERTLVSKLAAMFRLAKALDVSGRQKINSLAVQYKENSVLITASTAEGVFFEEWAFKDCAAFFKLVFGVAPILRIKRDIQGLSGGTV